MPTQAQDRAVYDEDLERRRCTANAKSTGARCKRRPIPGGRVCKMHGGGAPQVQASARRRLLEAVDPALSALIAVVDGPPGDWEMVEAGWESTGVWKFRGATHTERIRAAEAILDRTGYPRKTEVDLTDSRERLVEQLKALRDSGTTT